MSTQEITTLCLLMIIGLTWNLPAGFSQDEQETEEKLSEFAKNFVGVWKYDTTKTRNALKNIGIDSRASKPIISEQRQYLLTMHDDSTFEFRINRDLTGKGKWTIYTPTVEDNAGTLALIFEENEEIPVNNKRMHFQFDETMKVLSLRPDKANPFVVRRVRKVTEKSEDDKKGDGGDGGN